MENESRLEAFERMLKAVQENYHTADEKMSPLPGLISSFINTFLNAMTILHRIRILT